MIIEIKCDIIIIIMQTLSLRFYICIYFFALLIYVYDNFC